MFDFIKKSYSFLILCGSLLQPLILLGIRLYWGWNFFNSGLGKISDIHPIIDYFQTLGIPFPDYNAYAAALIECVGGFCLMIGFASRLVAIPLITVMSVALVTAHHEAFVNLFSDPKTFTQLGPFNYLLTALIILAFGPGLFSIDAIIKRAYDAEAPTEDNQL